MAKSTCAMETFLDNWNTNFPDYQLTVEELKKPLSVMGALFQIFDRLGIDRDAVLMPPPENNLNEHTMYYRDLIPVINMTRVFNHLASGMPGFGTININHFLHATALSSHSILLLMFNVMLFNEQRLREIAPYEEELFNVTNMVKALEDKKNKLLELLNEQAEEKGKRAERMEQTEQEIRQLEEDLKAEEQARDQEKLELEALITENNVTEVMLEQKRATKEGLLAERERKRALRVYDADDIKRQAAQAAQSVQEAEEKLHSLGETIAQKENSLKILQMIKPNLDIANNLLHEITKLKDNETGDLEADSKEGELEVLSTELLELRAHEAELAARREEGIKKRQEGQARRQQEKTMAESSVREAEEKEKKQRELIVRAVQRTQEIKHLTTKYESEKAKGFEAVKEIKESYNGALKAWEEALIRLITEMKTDIVNKQRSVEE